MKMLAVILLMLIAVAGVSAQTKHGDATVLGFHLGEKFTVPECARSKSGDGYSYDEVSAVCFRWDTVLQLPPVGTSLDGRTDLKLVFPSNKISEMTMDVRPEILDGNLEAVTIGTDGLATQDKVLDALKAKYGDPTEFAEKKIQNGYGAQFTSHAALWSFDNLTVYFGGTSLRTDSGIITVRSAKQIEYRAALAAKNSASSPKL